MRRKAAEALGNIGNEAAVNTLIQAFNYKDYDMRKRAAEALENIARVELIPHFFELLKTT